MFPAYREQKEDGEEAEKPGTPAQNELTAEVEVKNCIQHKSIIKARNEYYQIYKERFERSIQEVMQKYDELRKEEERFAEYWKQNLAEITKKHI